MSDQAHAVRGGRTLCGLEVPLFGSEGKTSFYQPKCPRCVKALADERRDKRTATV